MPTKPVITSVTGDRGGVVGADQPQTLFVKGTGFVKGNASAGIPGMALVFEGPMPVQVIREPGDPNAQPGDGTLQVQSDTLVLATVNVPVPIQGSPSNPVGKVWAVSGGLVSDGTTFLVGKG